MSLPVASYVAAAVSYGLLALVLVLRRDSGRQGRWVLLAVAGTAAWGLAVSVMVAVPLAPSALPIPDAARIVLWTLCLLTRLPGSLSWRSTKGILAYTTSLLGIYATAAPLLPIATNYNYLALLELAIVACIVVEQIRRNSTVQQRKALGPFLWTIAVLIIYDVYVFSDAVLFDDLHMSLWAPRGLLAAFAVPFFVLAAKRNPDWTETLFISREFVFYFATFVGIGLYLIGMAIGGFIIRERGGVWGVPIQAGYLVAAVLLLASILTSARLKAQLRVFISKHFYRNRYDYREEWLRLIRTLSDADEMLPLDQRSIKAMCDIVDSDGGQLWLDRDGRSVYEPFGAWCAPFPEREYAATSPLVRFLKDFQWVVDSREYATEPEQYQHAFRDVPAELPDASLIVPLVHQKDMLGFVRLNCAPDLRELNYEDHDLLKTAGRQVAAFLAHDLARERLAEGRQFDAYHRLSAFVMHDLKNLLAQQALLVENARKFRDRPDFIQDMVVTVDNG